MKKALFISMMVLVSACERLNVGPDYAAGLDGTFTVYQSVLDGKDGKATAFFVAVNRTDKNKIVLSARGTLGGAAVSLAKESVKVWERKEENGVLDLSESGKDFGYLKDKNQLYFVTDYGGKKLELYATRN